jgi:hypothetical protein
MFLYVKPHIVDDNQDLQIGQISSGTILVKGIWRGPDIVLGHTYP